MGGEVSAACSGKPAFQDILYIYIFWPAAKKNSFAAGYRLENEPPIGQNSTPCMSRHTKGNARTSYQHFPIELGLVGKETSKIGLGVKKYVHLGPKIVLDAPP